MDQKAFTSTAADICDRLFAARHVLGPEGLEAMAWLCDAFKHEEGAPLDLSRAMAMISAQCTFAAAAARREGKVIEGRIKYAAAEKM